MLLTIKLPVLSFSRRWRCRFQSSGMWRRVDWHGHNNDSGQGVGAYCLPLQLPRSYKTSKKVTWAAFILNKGTVSERKSVKSKIFHAVTDRLQTRNPGPVSWQWNGQVSCHHVTVGSWDRTLSCVSIGGGRGGGGFKPWVKSDKAWSWSLTWMWSQTEEVKFSFRPIPPLESHPMFAKKNIRIWGEIFHCLEFLHIQGFGNRIFPSSCMYITNELGFSYRAGLNPWRLKKTL